MELAAAFGITDYPSPAGGCILTDPNLGTRIEKFYKDEFSIDNSDFQANDIRLLLVGRQFSLPHGAWFVFGRVEEENNRIAELAEEGDWLLNMTGRPGPTGLLRRAATNIAGSPEESEIINLAAGLITRYARKVDGKSMPGEVSIDDGSVTRTVQSEPLADDIFLKWKM